MIFLSTYSRSFGNSMRRFLSGRSFCGSKSPGVSGWLLETRTLNIFPVLLKSVEGGTPLTYFKPMMGLGFPHRRSWRVWLLISIKIFLKILILVFLFVS